MQDARSGREEAFRCQAMVSVKSPDALSSENLVMRSVTGSCTTIFPSRSDRLAKPIGTNSRIASESSCNRGGSSNNGRRAVFSASAHSKTCDPFQKLFLSARFQGTEPELYDGTNCVGMDARLPTCNGSPDPRHSLTSHSVSKSGTSSVIGFT